MPQNSLPSAVFLQFAKWPEAGRVKTRLMPELGPAGALDAHIRLTLAVLDNLCATGYPVEFWWDRPADDRPGEAASIIEELEGAGLDQKVQEGNSLGERMHRSLEQSLRHFDRALVVGSDCPSVDPDYARKAVACLDKHDVVLGPSDDGGYVLIGASRVVEGMLDDIAWGTPAVLAQTCERLEAAGLSYYLLEPRWDVDEPEDWARFLRTC
ncbi:TIGR04282 family arsenosugar biosynthesis glycosyltransferase [Marinobacter sp. F3R08]|uniref:TIGR04282 family arsenosugar biosynthesis glycosyltransferase n=1 Tax=Marinobacter sp. F3R08 TaxID=2841559 RepID=UPI001C0A4F98|nr:TIGR04282 family arsenosugar biosynthesis glycosyltransferase [Marinobacter sp. F3R08]MBU2955081.1 TIGR04282 family arsenosugar biosynthesis glycosyltransferase [Marinobacter sp. F3R08]